MSATTIKSFSWLWIATLLTATVGVSVQQIYCYCVGKTSVSLFQAEDACAAEKEAKILECCQKNLETKATKSCCELPSPSSEKSGCTKKTTKFFQLKTEFTVGDKQFDSLSGVEFLALVPVIEYFYIPPFDLHLAAGFHPFAQPPPPLSGRMICVRQGVFRC